MIHAIVFIVLAAIIVYACAYLNRRTKPKTTNDLKLGQKVFVHNYLVGGDDKRILELPIVGIGRDEVVLEVGKKNYDVPFELLCFSLKEAQSLRYVEAEKQLMHLASQLKKAHTKKIAKKKKNEK